MYFLENVIEDIHVDDILATGVGRIEMLAEGLVCVTCVRTVSLPDGSEEHRIRARIIMPLAGFLTSCAAADAFTRSVTAPMKPVGALPLISKIISH